MKVSTYKLNVNYSIIPNHLKTLIYFHLAELNILKDISDFMKSNSDLKETIRSVSLGSLSNYNNDTDFNVFISVMQNIINKAINNLSGLNLEVLKLEF